MAPRHPAGKSRRLISCCLLHVFGRATGAPQTAAACGTGAQTALPVAPPHSTVQLLQAGDGVGGCIPATFQLLSTQPHSSVVRQPQFNVGHLETVEGAQKGIKAAGWDGVLLGGNYVAGVALGK